MEITDVFKIVEAAISDKAEGIITTELISMIRNKLPGVGRSTINEALRTMNDNGSIMYISRLGQTMVSRNINKAVRISERIWISPPAVKMPVEASKKKCVVIRLNPGIAFGNGIHPTTKMCINALDMIFERENNSIKRVMDLGTGTGVLAIGAGLLGADTILATDIDSCARAEAKANVALNRISDGMIEIADRQIEDISGKYDLVLANLRFPTLAALSKSIKKTVGPRGYLVFSGFRPEEKDRVLDHYSDEFCLENEKNENGWTSIVLKNRLT